MKMSKLSNHTNSQDPQAVNSRVFVGNLNTFQCSKTDVERMFQKYGRLAGISMHKGYAFVQFTNPFDARNACLGEDGRTVLGQVLDVNIVAEPKEHQVGRKRQNNTKTGNDWDYYYDSYYTSTVYPGRTILTSRPIKRQRLMTPQQVRPNMVGNGRVHGGQQQVFLPANMISNGNGTIFQMDMSSGETRPSVIEPSVTVLTQPNALGNLKVYSTPDTLICGNCKELFSGIGDLLEHKHTYCKLRFVCKCNANSSKSPDTVATNLLCAICKQHFPNAWDLMVHVQESHMINIYTLGTDIENNNNDDSVDNSNFQGNAGENTHENINNFLGCIDDAQSPSVLDFNTQAHVTGQSPIADLTLNSVESTVMSCSSRESSLSPQLLLTNQHSQNGLIRADDETTHQNHNLPCAGDIACTQSLNIDSGPLVAL